MRRWNILVPAVVVTSLLASPTGALAADFYVDPERGSPSGDGSMEAPWQTLQQVVEAGLIETRHWSALPYEEGVSALAPVNAGAPVQPGDTIWLASGLHGALELQGAYNASPITIAALPDASPQLTHARFRAASNWTLRGVSISPTHDVGAEPAGTLVDIDNHGFHGPSDHIVVDGCVIFGAAETSAFVESDWVGMPNAVTVDGADVTVSGNEITNIRFGISVTGVRAQILRNVVRNFAGDGLRGLGDDGLFEGNYVANAYDVDDNHDDGFQSWSTGPEGVGSGEVRGVVLRGNTIVNYEDPDQPFRGPLQGIGCFDGFFTGWVVENNVVIVDHWHGITFLGMRDSRVVNNTVLDLNDERPGPPWISVTDHKDGTPSSGCTVRNNLATDFDNGAGVTEDHNLVIADPAAHFVGPTPPYDVHLRDDSPAIDTGSADMAPATDHEGIARPFGDEVDVGAHEWHDGTAAPVDAGPPSGVDAGPRMDAGPLPPGTDAGPLPPGTDAGPLPPGTDAGPGGSVDGGCGCAAPGGASATPAWLALLALGLLARRRS